MATTNPSIFDTADALITEQGGKAAAPAQAPVAPSSGSAAPRSGPAAFVAQYGDVARKVGERLGVAPEALLGQWGLETGWGRSVIPGTNNLGNIKDPSGRGVWATDNMNGSRDAYQTYASTDEFAEQFVPFIEKSKRYKGAVGTGSNYQGYFTALKQGGYAEDPNYVVKGVGAAKMAAALLGVKPGQAVAKPNEPGGANAPGATPSAPYYDGPDQRLIVAPERLPERTALQGARDVGIGAVAGLVQGGKLLADVTGADGAVSESLDRTIKSLNESQSPQRKEQRAARQREIQNADEYGTTTDQVLANIGAFIDAPFEATANAIGTSAPTLLVGLIPGLNASVATMLIARGAVGAAQGIGGAKGAIFDAAKTKLMERGVPEEEAVKVAAGLQEYNKENAGILSAAGALGALAGSTGFDKALTTVLGKEGVKAATGSGAKQIAKDAGAGILKEAPLEGAQGGQERYASNTALMRADLEDDPMRGVLGAAAGEAVTSAGPGAAFGLLGRGSPPGVPPAPPPNPVADQAGKPNSPLSRAAISGNPDLAPPPADPLTLRAKAIEQQVRDGGLLQTLRDIGQDGRTVPEFLDALVAAKNPNESPAVRQQALDSLEMAMGWIADGVMPGDQSTGAPFSTDLTVPPGPGGGGVATNPIAPQDVDDNTVDVNATRVDNMIGGPRALPAPPDPTDPTSPPPDAPADAGVSASGANPSGPSGNPATTTESNDAPEANQAQQAEAQRQEAPASPVTPPSGDPAPTSPAAPAAPRRQVPIPQATAAPGEGTAQIRKRKAQIGQLVATGFETVEQRDGRFWLVNPKTNEEAALASPLDAQLARKAIADEVRARSTQTNTAPTDGQKEAGNYKKGSVNLNGLTIRVENPLGSTRSGTDEEGNPWESTMTADYGYIPRTEGADGDQVDVFIGNRPDSSRVFVVDQVNPKTGAFDEHKVMMGYPTIEAARAGYLSNYQPGWQGLGAITEMPLADFRKWSKSPDAKKPLSDTISAGANNGGNSTKRPADTVRPAEQAGAGGPPDLGAAGRAPGGDSVGAQAVRAGAVPGEPDGQTAAQRAAEADVDRTLDAARRADPSASLDRADPNDPATRALDALLDAMARLTGYRGTAVKWVGRGSADGVYMPGSNTFLVNVGGAQQHVASTVAHEFKHLSERFPGIGKLYDRLWAMIPEAGRKDYFDNYLPAGKGVGYENATAEQLATLKDEMLADFMGGRFKDRDWLKQLAKQKPALFGEFVRDWIRVLETLVGDLKKLAGINGGRGIDQKSLDRYIEDLEGAKAIAMEVAAEWAANNPKLAEQAGLGSVADSLRNSARESEVELQAMLRAELEAELNQPVASPAVRRPQLDVSDAELAAFGVMAEDAYEDLNWQAQPNSAGNQLFTEVAGLRGPGNGGKVYMDKGQDGLWGVGLPTSWFGPAAAEKDGNGSKNAVQAYVKRQAVAADLRGRGFDLAEVVNPQQARAIVDAFRALEKVEPSEDGKGARRYGKPGRASNSFREIAADMGLTGTYDINVTRDPLDPNETLTNVTFANRETGKVNSLLIKEIRANGMKYIELNTIEMGKGGLGAAAYQMAAEYAARRSLSIRPESQMSAINSYRRTEQMLSAALRTGKSNIMVPHPSQRVYGFNENANRVEQHEQNLARLLLAGLRNARELVPNLDALNYNPESGVFTNEKGGDQGAQIDRLLSSVDSRALGLGRSTLARAVMTRMVLDGELNASNVKSIKEPILYSARVQADAEYQAVDDKYRGTPQWLKAPNGSTTGLTERQWVQVRTPSFKRWFGDWESYADKRNGVWSDRERQVSRVVDENGEPLVVYHGTDKGGFMAFNQPGGKKRGDLGIFTTSNENMARTYVRRGRMRDIEPPTTLRDLEDMGYQFIQGPEGLEVTGPDGYTMEGPQENDFRFASVPEAADAILREFTGEEGVSGIYAAFANIRDPNEDDFQGALWSGERPGQFVVMDEEGLTVTDKLGKEFYSEERDARKAAKLLGGEVEPAPDHYTNTDSVVREAANYNQDGAIIRNVVDEGGGASAYNFEPSDVFVALKPNQLKSAEWNTGEFGDTDDLRFSERASRYMGQPEAQAEPEVAEVEPAPAQQPATEKADPTAVEAKGRSVSYQTTTPDTGEAMTISQDAGAALQAYDDRVGVMERLMACLAK